MSVVPTKADEHIAIELDLDEMDVTSAETKATLGSYEWRVLDKNGKELLLITKDAVEEKPYNEDNSTNANWEKSTLRKWLNNSFCNSTFSWVEQSRIITTKENDTQDKVFLLSLNEADKYFNSDLDRVCEYKGNKCRWWLCSPGGSSEGAAYVYSDGSVLSYGNHVIPGNFAVRPALWINLES